MNTINCQGCDNEVTRGNAHIRSLASEQAAWCGRCWAGRQEFQTLELVRGHGPGLPRRPHRLLSGANHRGQSSRMQTAGVGMADVRFSPRQAPSPVGFTRAVPSQCSGGQQDGAAWRCSLCP